jgi:hypothetical protein
VGDDVLLASQGVDMASAEKATTSAVKQKSSPPASTPFSAIQPGLNRTGMPYGCFVIAVP